MSFWDLFTLSFKWDFYSIILVIAFIVAIIVGYILIYQQIHLVKAETMSARDHFKCILYGIVFACGILIVLTTLLLFRIYGKNPIYDTTHLAILLLWPLNFVILLLYLFPLVDFLYMAYLNSNKGLTPFQEFFASNFIHKFDTRWKRYLVATSLWIGLFILPPFLLSIKIPPFIAIMGWSFAYPISIIAFFGYRGYAAGIVKNVYTHHTMSRALHLTFDKSPRIFNVIFYRFYSTFILIIDTVTYFVIIIDFIDYIIYFFIGQVLITPRTKLFTISMSLIFGVTGYFSRFWGKKIKFRWIDIMLAGWLIASVGINIMVNFMILRLDRGLDVILNSWSVSSIITQTTIMKGGNYVLFIPVALIEEFMFILLVNYYLFSKNSNFFLQARLNLMELASSNFIPIPLFNFVHHSNSKLRHAAKDELIRMYGRLPLRADINYTHKRYMYPLLDGLSDSNRYNREVSQIILNDAIHNHPNRIAPYIISALQSGNSDKQLLVGAQILNNPEFVQHIPPELIVHLFIHPNHLMKRLGADLLLKLPNQPSSLSNESVLRGISDPDYEFQGKCMEIATKFGLLKDINVLLEKVNGSKSHLEQATIQSFVDLLNREDTELTKKDISHILEKLNSSNTSSRDAAIISISRIPHLDSSQIPFEPFIAGIKSHLLMVREASERVLRQLMTNLKTSDASKLFNTLVSLSDSTDEEIIQHIAPLLALNWKQYPQKVLVILIKFLKNPNAQTQKIVQQALMNIASEDPVIVLNSLFPIRDERKYLTKSIIQQTICQICSSNPESIAVLESSVQQSDITVKKNVLTAMEELSQHFASFFDLHLLFESVTIESITEIQLKLLSVLLNVIQNRKELDPRIISDLNPLLRDEDRDLRKRAMSIVVEIAKISPSLIPLDLVRKFTEDSDTSIRELGAKVLQYYTSTQRNLSLQLLKALLDDEKWIVRAAVIDTLIQSKSDILDPELIKKILSMMDQSDEWLSRKIIEFILHLGKLNTDYIPIETIHKLSIHPNPYIRKMILKNVELLDFDKAWDFLRILLEDTDTQVREQATRSLVRISKDMKISTLYSYTLHYFSDETNIILQQSLAKALQRIIMYESEEVRNRLIGILKIRCKLSQDPILCQIWHELEEK